MGQRGPNRKPTALRILEGNPSKRPLPNEPKREALTAEEIIERCPERLGTEEREHFRYYAELYAPSKIITLTDLIMLENLAIATTERIKFEKQANEAGPLYKTHTGFIAVSPMRRLVAVSRDRETKLLREFGSSPTARTGVQPVAGSSAANKWANLG